MKTDLKDLFNYLRCYTIGYLLSLYQIKMKVKFNTIALFALRMGFPVSLKIFNSKRARPYYLKVLKIPYIMRKNEKN